MKITHLILLGILAILAPACGRGGTTGGTTPSATDQGVPVSALSTSNQMSPEIASDGAGGAIIFWLDTRNPAGYSIYAQRITKGGNTLWTTDGVPICVLPGSRWNMQAVPDGAGGATVVWGDDRSGSLDIYAQRVNAAGVVQWTNNGVAVCSASGAQDHPELAPDGTGGAVVAWQDDRNGSPEVYSQRINGAGAIQWPAAGVLICSVACLQSYPRVVTDGAQGGIVVWQDLRSPGFSVFAQRVNSAGAVQWTANGVLLCGAPNTQGDPEAISDGAGGAIVAWSDARSGIDFDIYAQRINGSGTLLWTADGAPICTAAGSQGAVQLTADGSGGAIIAWTDQRSGTGYDLYAQRVNSAGTRQWATDGVAICTSGGVSWEPQVVSDGAGGAIIAWTDNRNTIDNDAYVQRVNSSGVVQWTTNGLPVCTVPGDLFTIGMVSDGLGGAIMTWDDRRNPTPDVYARPVSAAGTFP